MKRIVLAGALALAAAGQVLAADLPPAMAPPPRAPAAYIPVAPAFSWSGIYVGINGGYALGNSQWSGPATPPNFSVNGGVVGGQVGANWQFNQFVLGVEADIDYNGVKGTSVNGFCTSQPGVPTCNTSSDWLSTVRGRAGFAWDRVLFYGTAGGAFGNIKAGLSTPGTFVNTTGVGWTAGAGTEVALSDNWTARLEYLYVSMTNGSCNIVANCSPSGPAVTGVSLNENIIRAGINYKFGGF